MYKEIEKYKTGDKTNMTSNFTLNGTVVKYPTELDEYDFELGDLLFDFSKHINKPWWRRKYYHKHLTKTYLSILNQVWITYGF